MNGFLAFGAALMVMVVAIIIIGLIAAAKYLFKE